VNRRFWVGFVAAGLFVAFLSALSWFGGSPRSTAADTFRAFIDADTTDGICDLPEDTSLNLPGATNFSVAVCVEDPPAALGAFDFTIIYDDTVILAPEVADSGTALDDNPDANQAALGGDWDCTGFGTLYPTGDTDPASGPGHGAARLACLSLVGPWTFTSTGHLALVNFQAQGVVGASALALQGVVVGDFTGTEIGSCNPLVSFPVPCVDAAVSVGGAPMVTSTPGGTPAATPAGPAPNTPTPAPTPPPESADVVDLTAACNPVTTTYPDGTTVQTLTAATSPAGILDAMWKFEGGVWSGYSPEFPQASDLAVTQFLDVVFLCVDTAGTFVRPIA